jgi:hypothetical protein
VSTASADPSARITLWAGANLTLIENGDKRTDVTSVAYEIRVFDPDDALWSELVALNEMHRRRASGVVTLHCRGCDYVFDVGDVRYVHLGIRTGA